MLKGSFSIVVLLIVSAALCGLPAISAQGNVDLKSAAVRSKIESLRMHTRVEVKLHDKTKLRGQISGADSDSFYLDNQAGGNTKVLYSEVSEVKKEGGDGQRSTGSSSVRLLEGW